MASPLGEDATSVEGVGSLAALILLTVEENFCNKNARPAYTQRALKARIISLTQGVEYRAPRNIFIYQ